MISALGSRAALVFWLRSWPKCGTSTATSPHLRRRVLTHPRSSGSRLERITRAIPSRPHAAGSILIHAESGRWINYQERDPNAVAEVPPLPPEATNSNSNTGRDGHDAGHRSPPTAPPGPPNQYTHHLIRDFMFLDAATANPVASGPPAGVTPQASQDFTVQFRTLDPNDASEDPDLRRFTRGTKHPLVRNKNSR